MTEAKSYEDEIRSAQSLDYLNQVYEAASKSITDKKELRRIYKAYQKRQFELKYKHFKELKQELAQRKKGINKQKVDVQVHVRKSIRRSLLVSAEHYILKFIIKENEVVMVFMKRVKLVEREGYLIVEDKKAKESWIVSSEPFLMTRGQIRKRMVAVHFVTTSFPYTLAVELDEKAKAINVKAPNGPHTLYSIMEGKLIEQVMRSTSARDIIDLIIGAMIGLGFGMAIGIMIAHGLFAPTAAAHAVNATVVHHNVTNTTTFTIPHNATGGKT
ncbi:B277 family protein [Sulfuracidifex metallicus]|uniref:Uncharacterized protein n=1 Tax=Sulfuracidifex metallicus DSM 6482 = JCM 9184 TaxID=523847 RepID=A0A6A9QLU4_SULME|nr:B277 family protein [Sulfuracidifex metallicus]MUN29976.1 hypothetical protein [Sulfuracidifex metallicus DSM 6482 = JCM 9184]WOE51643.1 B277 family protein [Sulfuracidifex metallicus DSM 6482 = JCM 9184]